MKRVAFGELDGLSRKRRPVFVYTPAPSGPRAAVALTRDPASLTAILPPPPALSVRIRGVRGASGTGGVALGAPEKASQTLALSV